MESFNDLDENDKQAWLELFEQQDGSAKEFCQHNNLNYHQFLNWKRSRNPPQEIDFVEIDCKRSISGLRFQLFRFNVNFVDIIA